MRHSDNCTCKECQNEREFFKRMQASSFDKLHPAASKISWKTPSDALIHHNAIKKEVTLDSDLLLSSFARHDNFMGVSERTGAIIKEVERKRISLMGGGLKFIRPLGDSYDGDEASFFHSDEACMWQPPKKKINWSENVKDLTLVGRFVSRKYDGLKLGAIRLTVVGVLKSRADVDNLIETLEVHKYCLKD